MESNVIFNDGFGDDIRSAMLEKGFLWQVCLNTDNQAQ